MLSAAVVGLASQSYRMEVTTTMDVEDPEGFDEFSQRFGIEATSTGMRDASGKPTRSTRWRRARSTC